MGIRALAVTRRRQRDAHAAAEWWAWSERRVVWTEGVWRVMGVVERGSSAAWTLGRFWGASQSFSDSGTRARGQWEGAVCSVGSGRTKGGSVWGERRGSGQGKAAARGRVQRAVLRGRGASTSTRPGQRGG